MDYRISGLSLILFLETNEYLKGITTGYGMRVNIQKPSTYPFPADEGMYIPASMETDIALKLVNITRLGGNYGDCNDGVEFRKLYNTTYTRRACQSFCQMSTVFKDCSCFDVYWEEFAFSENKNLKPCRSKTEITCLLDIERKYYAGNLTCSCVNPCSEASYRKVSSQRQWPSNEYARVLLEWVCDRDIKTCEILRNDLDKLWAVNNNFLKLNIYFEDLNFENITETAEIEVSLT
ncbi:amiloride-sensitive sodium channel subunit alpha-like isoform X1 [Mercenaria mercenaria]|uniref:amiloride-sensitive sodium channel subunit alpha-like isoform X1 n=2 Tax=Mercenaria mercenaria TaxID=6596 RepID=UPI00234E64D8|nr:amiloride-sensitive sodium channel subunit alpha-like isoform X1 [Mercenaria mercenaria]